MNFLKYFLLLFLFAHYTPSDIAAQIAKDTLISIHGKDTAYRVVEGYSKHKTALSNSVKDTLPLKHKTLYGRQDSIHKLKSLTFHKDSAVLGKSVSSATLERKRNQQLLDRRQDSLRKNQQTLQRKQVLLAKTVQGWKRDSARLKSNIKSLNNNLLILSKKSANITLRDGRKKLVIAKEFDCNSSSVISLENIGRTLIIKTHNENTIKLQATILVDSAAATTIEPLEKILRLEVIEKNNIITVRGLDSVYKQEVKLVPSNSIVKETGAGKTITVSDKVIDNVNRKIPLTIYIPLTAKLEVKNSYNDLQIMDNVKNADLDLKFTKLIMKDAEKIVLSNKNASVTTGNVKDATMNLENCKLQLLQADSLTIQSRNSSIDAKSIGVAKIESVSDNYKFGKVDYVTANKTFGKFDIINLNQAISLTGTSADLYISTIEEGVKMVEVQNKYAEIKLPLQELKSYTVQFDGVNNRVYAPFKLNNKDGDSTIIRTPFTQEVGITNGNKAQLNLLCSQCIVDFREAVKKEM